MKYILPNLNCVKKPVCYALVFDSGYFYIGATANLEMRIKQHKCNIRNNPVNYLIGITHEPNECKIIKLISCNDIEAIFKYERDYILYNSHNVKMINGEYGTDKIKLFDNKINEAFKSLNNNNIV